jgi:hypothetical protein
MDFTNTCWPLGWLPNREGFQFIGICKDGTAKECRVARDETGVHFISGDAIYDELHGWREKSAQSESLSPPASQSSR